MMQYGIDLGKIIVKFERSSIDEADGTCVVWETYEGRTGCMEWGPMKIAVVQEFVDKRRAEIEASIQRAVQRLRERPLIVLE